MSVEAISWTLNLGPGPADRRGQPSSAYKYLVGLADHAGPDGSGALLSVASLVRYTGRGRGISEIAEARDCADRPPGAMLIL